MRGLFLCGHLQVRLRLKPRGLLVLALDHILLRTLDDLGKLLTGLAIMLEQVVLYKTLGCLAHPLEKREVLELV